MPEADRDATRRAFSKPAAFVVLDKGLTLKTELTAARLRELLHYDPETGVFTRRIAVNNRTKVGEVAGGPNTADGYIRIRIDGRCYMGHRLAWLYVHGRWPQDQIDHIDTVRDHNWIANLRQANNAENKQNLKRARKDNACGLLGAFLDKKSGRWRACISVNGKNRSLGYHSDPSAAHAAYVRAKAQLHPFQTLTASADPTHPLRGIALPRPGGMLRAFGGAEYGDGEVPRVRRSGQ